jgi:putative transposase
MDTRWKRSNHSVYNCGFHLIWTSKYRRTVLIDGVDVRLKELLLQKAKEHDWHIEKMEVMPDHVHIFIKVTPTDAPAFVVSQLKGFSSFTLRNEFPSLKSRLPTLWTRAFYCESVGHISEATIKKYIDDQKNV